MMNRLIKPLCLITIKPVMFLANVDEKGFENNSLLDDLNAYASSINCPLLLFVQK